MSSYTSEEKYARLKDANGGSYYCPRDLTAPDADDCVETDVVERYAGNLNITDAHNR